MTRYVVGLTGGIGSGKSTVADLFAAHGIVVVDADAVAHELTGPGGAAMPSLADTFGPGILRPDGGLDRAAMRQLVFGDPDKRLQLESILHPMIQKETAGRCQAATSPYAIMAIPLLVESGGGKGRFQRVLVVDCSESLQVARVMARNGLPEPEVRAIMAAQASRAQRLAVADDVIVNEDGIEALAAQVAELHERYVQYSTEIAKVKC